MGHPRLAGAPLVLRGRVGWPWVSRSVVLGGSWREEEGAVKSSRLPGNCRVGWDRKDSGVCSAHTPPGAVSVWQARSCPDGPWVPEERTQGRRGLPPGQPCSPWAPGTEPS